MNAVLFDEKSPFIQRDNRKHRPSLRTTAELLNRRHQILVPQSIVEQRSVLDLGCALAATGKWVLDRDAKSYLGVELQKGYADIAAELLQSNRRARIERADAYEFASICKERFDVVTLIGLIHGLHDPIAMLTSASTLASHYVCIETEGDESEGPGLRPSRDMRMPHAERLGSSAGFGWRIAPSALTLIMERLGFVQDGEAVSIIQGRYAVRFKRGTVSIATASELQNVKEWRNEQWRPDSILVAPQNAGSNPFNVSNETLDAEELLALARLSLEKNDLENALLRLKRLMTIGHISPEAMLMSARVHAQLRLFTKAEGFFSRYLELNRSASLERFELGMVRFDAGNVEGALQAWNALLQDQPNYPPALFFKSLALVRKGDITNAKTLLEQLIKWAPEDNPYLNRAKDLLKEIAPANTGAINKP